MVYRYIHCTGHAFLPMNVRGKERVTCLRTSAWRWEAITGKEPEETNLCAFQLFLSLNTPLEFMFIVARIA